MTSNEWMGLPLPEPAAQRLSQGEVMNILYAGIDLAKNVFTVHGMNEVGSAELRRPKVARAKPNRLIASLPLRA